mmetsp:Transcript_61863/g.70963  ORF Transcript_61863/g.70963 Transcript_61863/m.70963 type:complete len:89 (+) Transcript_61863:173-439(+)
MVDLKGVLHITKKIGTFVRYKSDFHPLRNFKRSETFPIVVSTALCIYLNHLVLEKRKEVIQRAIALERFTQFTEEELLLNVGSGKFSH